MSTFEQANKTVHPVTTQWHYPILTKHGYVADTKEAVGLVRCYTYTHPTTKHSMLLTTGMSSDYWTDKRTGKVGYWNELDTHLTSISEGAI